MNSLNMGHATDVEDLPLYEVRCDDPLPAYPGPQIPKRAHYRHTSVLETDHYWSGAISQALLERDVEQAMADKSIEDRSRRVKYWIKRLVIIGVCACSATAIVGTLVAEASTGTWGNGFLSKRGLLATSSVSAALDNLGQGLHAAASTVGRNVNLTPVEQFLRTILEVATPKHSSHDNFSARQGLDMIDANNNAMLSKIAQTILEPGTREEPRDHVGSYKLQKIMATINGSTAALFGKLAPSNKHETQIVQNMRRLASSDNTFTTAATSTNGFSFGPDFVVLLFIIFSICFIVCGVGCGGWYRSARNRRNRRIQDMKIML